MSNEVFFKPSLNLDSFFGDEFFEDNERFLLFLKGYYEWLQTTTVVFTDKTGTFQRGEQVVGATSKATGIIREVKTNSLIIQVTTKKAFAKSETITGQTSGATATIYSVKDNVVRASGNVVDYRNLDNSIDKYFEYLKDELYTSLPVDFYGNKPLVASKFKDFFNSKSNEQSYRFLFRLLYNEEIDFYYPGDDIIRSSDGNFEKTQIIRTTAVGFGINNAGTQYERNIFDFLNKTIRGKTSNALAFVVDIKKFFIGSIETAEMTLRLVSADFDAGEEIVDIDDEDLNATLYGIVAGFTINDGGSGYQVSDAITISGDGSEAQAIVSSIKQSPITALKVNTVGHGYRLGTTASINNAGTGGTGLIVKVTELANTYIVTNANTGNTYTVGEVVEVSVINRGSGYFASPTITLVDTTIESLGLLSDKLVTITNPGTNYQVGDALVITANTGANAVGQIASVTSNASFSNTLLFEDGFEILFEQSYDDVAKSEDWNVGSYGPIARIEFTNFGNGYLAANTPTITVSTSSGANASLTVVGVQGMSANVEVDTANNITGIGSIRAVEISNFGIDYSTATANATSTGDGNANLTPIISGIGVSQGGWLDDDGKLDYKILQDSYYYQDYSYVIKSGLTVEKYIDTIKRSIHPAGLQLFGEILLIDTLNVASEFKSAIETIKDFIVRIYDFVTVAPAFGEFNIAIETTIESFFQLPVAIIPNTDIADQQYVIQFTQTNVSDCTSTLNKEIIIKVKSNFDTESLPIPYEVTKLVVSYTNTLLGYTNTDIADQEYVIQFTQTNVSDCTHHMEATEIAVKVESEFDTESLPIPYDVTKLVISYTNIFLGYTISELGGLGESPISPYSNTAISVLAEETFGIAPGSLDRLGETIIFLVPGGDDTPYVENLEISTYRQHNFIIESFWIAAATVLISDIQTEQTGTREVEIDSITFINVESSVSTEILSTYLFGPLVVDSSWPNREYSIVVESLGFANAEFTMIIAASSVTPQKIQSSENIVFAYGTNFADLLIEEIAGATFESYIPENDFIDQIKDRTFLTTYRSSPRTSREYVVTYQNVDTTIFEVPSREIVVKMSPGIAYELWSSLEISELSSTQLNEFENVVVGGFKEFVEGGTSIPVSPSQWPLGQNPSRVEFTDTVFKEYELSISHENYANYNYDGIRLELFADAQLSSLSSVSLTTQYDSIPVSNFIDKYSKIAGNISFQTVGSNTIILGAGTNFSSDFAAFDKIVANNELFIVESVSNTTYMIVDREPSSLYSNIFAYKQI